MNTLLKKFITLDALDTTTSSEVLASKWAQENNLYIKTVKVLRVIEKSHTLEITYSNTPIEPTLKALNLKTGIDYDRDAKLTPFGIASLKDRYLLPTETSPQDAFMRAAKAFADNEAHAQRLYDYVSKLWFMFATPVLSNAPVRTSWGQSFEENFKPEHFDSKKRGMPISCFLSYVPDSREGLTSHYTENAWLSSIGGGVGSYWGGVRSNGVKTSHGSASSGIIPFIGVMDRMVLAFAQGVTRRASYAAYLDIGHPEILEFLEIRKPSGGDANRKSLNIHNAVNIPDAFMEIIEACMKDPDASDDWPLIDPHTKTVVEIVSAKMLWQKLLELRAQTGEPYIMFVDTVNRAMPQAQKDAGLRVYQSNLCSEITLATNEQRTAVCCLSSVNLEYYDEWSKDPLFVSDLIRMLDNVLEYFIQNAPPSLSKAIYSAKMERSVGLGCMGFHSYLQKIGLPFESALATSVNRQVFSFLKRNAEKATSKLAQERGPCPDAMGAMIRNMHLLAIAPNASTSVLCGGTSPGIEPNRANAFTHKTQSGSWLVRNKYLEDVLTSYGMNTEETWQSIVLNKGSVQHLESLPQSQKDVFKTAIELDQRWIIEHASHRQDHICQSQSVNTFFAADASILYLHNVHFMAWKKGLKSLYYLRSEAIKRADNVSVKISTAELKDIDNTCLSCEG